jgi:hypothetical protein
MTLEAVSGRASAKGLEARSYICEPSDDGNTIAAAGSGAPSRVRPGA